MSLRQAAAAAEGGRLPGAKSMLPPNTKATGSTASCPASRRRWLAR
ncbi:hypothetical protein [Paenibacillus koleovorans]|nr:hypothetical protein [Paenibacillus koleovorans]